MFLDFYSFLFFIPLCSFRISGVVQFSLQQIISNILLLTRTNRRPLYFFNQMAISAIVICSQAIDTYSFRLYFLFWIHVTLSELSNLFEASETLKDGPISQIFFVVVLHHRPLYRPSRRWWVVPFCFSIACTTEQPVLVSRIILDRAWAITN